jgi:LPXTG-site transpeptidase (sortase) family protein
MAASARSRLITGTPLAELSIPRVGLSAVVLHGTDEHTLRLGLGHVENTPLPGESGNVAIAGHRDSFFRPLRNVHVGDDILLETPEERVHYRVSSLRVVNSYEVSVIGPTRDATLTLVTCYPFWFIGQAPDRFVVRATRVESSAALPKNAENSAPTPNNEDERRPILSKTMPSHETRGPTDDGLTREAIDHFSAAVKSDPAYSEARLQLAETLRASGRFQESLPQYEETITLNPRLAEARLGFGMALAGLKRMDEARKQFGEGARIFPDRREFGEALNSLSAGSSR